MQAYDSTGWDNGIHGWNVSPANIVYTKATPANITVTDTYNSGVTWDGLTSLAPCLSCSPYTSATAWLNSYFTRNYSPGAIQSVTTHELGHIAGLAHVTNCAIMVADTSTRYYNVCGIWTPQTDDVNGINALY
jgi:predicted Zn-dependent protease